MNVFAKEIVKHSDIDVRVNHYVKGKAPLPLGSALKISRLSLIEGEQPAQHDFENLKRELFIDCSWSKTQFHPWVKDGVYVHIGVGPCLFDSYAEDRSLTVRYQYRSFIFHIVPEKLFHEVEQKDEYEFWKATEEELQLLKERKLKVDWTIYEKRKCL